MSRLVASTFTEERVLAGVKRLCLSERLDGDELLREAVEMMRPAVPFDAYCASTVDPATGMITRATSREMGGEREAVLFFERLYFEHEFPRLTRMGRERRPVELLSEATRGRLDRSGYYREMLVPLGYAHQARAAFVEGGSLWGTAHMPRERGRADFSAREVALIRRLAPHVGSALRIAALRARALEGSHPDADVPGVLNLDANGRVERYTPAAERLLRDLGDLGPRWREGVGLPPAVRMVRGSLLRALGTRSERDLESVPRLRVRGRSGRWLTLYGSLTEVAPGSPQGVAVVVAPSKPDEVAWLTLAAYGLSEREREVVTLVARGLSTRQISSSLFISGYTVQNHLQNVFEKVGVRSRRELVKRLFIESLYPSVFG